MESPCTSCQSETETTTSQRERGSRKDDFTLPHIDALVDKTASARCK